MTWRLAQLSLGGNGVRPGRDEQQREHGCDPGSLHRYGVVVESVNVSVLLYVPVRRGSVAPIACLNVIVTGSFETGADVGLDDAQPLERLRERERAVDQVVPARPCSDR